MKKQLMIVTGANGALGNCYLSHYLKKQNTACVAISRSFMNTTAQHYQLDLLDSQATAKAIKAIDLTAVADIVLIHAVGKFKYEGLPHKATKNADIDQDIWASNYNTLTNIVNPLVEKLKQTSSSRPQATLAVCAFGSVTDKYNIPLWRSYSLAKDAARTFIQDMLHSKVLWGHLRGRFINVSTTDTGNENKLRPYATAEERRYWLKPQKIVDQSVKLLNRLQPAWQEVDIYEPMPEFDPQVYYGNYQNIQTKWNRQMGLTDSPL